MCFNLCIYFFLSRQIFSIALLSRTATVYCSWKWKRKNKNKQTSQERNSGCKGWKQVVLDLPFPDVTHEGWWWFQTRADAEARVPRVKNPFVVNLFERLQAFCNIVLSTDRGKDLFDEQHLLCHLIEELSIKKLSSRCARGHIAPEVNRSHW